MLHASPTITCALVAGHVSEPGGSAHLPSMCLNSPPAHETNLEQNSAVPSYSHVRLSWPHAVPSVGGEAGQLPPEAPSPPAPPSPLAVVPPHARAIIGKASIHPCRMANDDAHGVPRGHARKRAAPLCQSVPARLTVRMGDHARGIAGAEGQGPSTDHVTRRSDRALAPRDPARGPDAGEQTRPRAARRSLSPRVHTIARVESAHVTYRGHR